MIPANEARTTAIDRWQAQSLRMIPANEQQNISRTENSINNPLCILPMQNTVQSQLFAKCRFSEVLNRFFIAFLMVSGK